MFFLHTTMRGTTRKYWFLVCMLKMLLKKTDNIKIAITDEYYTFFIYFYLYWLFTILPIYRYKTDALYYVRIFIVYYIRFISNIWIRANMNDGLQHSKILRYQLFFSIGFLINSGSTPLIEGPSVNLTYPVQVNFYIFRNDIVRRKIRLEIISIQWTHVKILNYKNVIKSLFDDNNNTKKKKKTQVHLPVVKVLLNVERKSYDI